MAIAFTAQLASRFVALKMSMTLWESWSLTQWLEMRNLSRNTLGGDLGNYLSQHTLRPRSWGSNVEIFAAATLLQTTIVVFTPTSPDCRKWLSHPPLFSITGVLPSAERIYLSNLCSHFEHVIRVWICFEHTRFKSQKTLHTCWDLEAVTLIPHHLFFPSCPFVLGPNRDVHEFGP